MVPKDAFVRWPEYYIELERGFDVLGDMTPAGARMYRTFTNDEWASLSSGKHTWPLRNKLADVGHYIMPGNIVDDAHRTRRMVEQKRDLSM